MNENIRVDHLSLDTNITYWCDQIGGVRFMKRQKLGDILGMLESLYEGAPPYYLDEETYLPYPWEYEIF